MAIVKTLQKEAPMTELFKQHVMKVVILDGSHNKKGSTSALISEFAKGVKEVNPKANIITYDLLSDKINFCKGCLDCMKDDKNLKAECIIDDVCKKIKHDAMHCDVLVFASPIYEYAVSSAMKRFLERCASLVTFKFGLAPKQKPLRRKQAIILCSSGAPYPFNHLMGITRYPKSILKFSAKLFRCKKIKMLFAGGMSINDKIKTKYQRKARMLGRNSAHHYLLS